MFLQLHLHIFRNVIQSTYISKCDLQFCKSRQCFVLKQLQYYKYCFCIFSLSFLIFLGQGFVEVPQLLKSVSSFTYRIVNRILRFVSRNVSNRGIVYRYTPSPDALNDLKFVSGVESLCIYQMPKYQISGTKKILIFFS